MKARNNVFIDQGRTTLYLLLRYIGQCMCNAVITYVDCYNAHLTIDDIVIFAESKDELQRSLDALLEYCNRWKLVVNTRKTKIKIFKKSGRLPHNTVFNLDNVEIEIVKNFTYLAPVALFPKPNLHCLVN